MLLCTGIGNMLTKLDGGQQHLLLFVPVFVTRVTLLDGGQQHLLLLCTGICIIIWVPVSILGGGQAAALLLLFTGVCNKLQG